MEITLDMKDLLVPSENFKNGGTGRCYVGLFSSALTKYPPGVYLGMIFMKKYYTFYDVNGLQAGTASKPILGFGLKAPNANIL
jgi:hypothetical protein